jgi:6-phosphogluconolactonase
MARRGVWIAVAAVALLAQGACSGSKGGHVADAAAVEEPGVTADGPAAPITRDTAVADAGGGATADTVSAPDLALVDGPAPMDGAAAPGDSPGPMVYVGGFRPEIDVFRLDMATVKLTKMGTVARPPMKPSFFAWRRSGKLAFSVDEVDAGKVVSFSIDQTTGMLTRLGEASVMGVGPTYIALDRTEKWALSACWAGNSVASIAVTPVGDDGMLGPPADVRTFKLNGYAHFITTDPSNKYVLASINGEESVAQYRFDAATGKLTENQPPRVMRPKGSGPRHMDFHPNGRIVYLINEQGNTVTVFGFDDAKGVLTQLQDIPTLPPGYTGVNSTAHILVHKSGKFVYGSNRGHDSIVIYGVDANTGMLKLIGHQTGVGAKPRNFAIDPTGTLLLVAGQDSGMLSLYKIDQSAGTLTKQGASIAVGSMPTYVGVIDVPAR